MQKYAQIQVKVKTHSQYQWAGEHKQITQIAQHTKVKMQTYAQYQVKVEKHSQHQKAEEHNQITQMEMG